MTELKIEVDFVSKLGSDPANVRVVHSLVDVAGNFVIRTVAEGHHIGHPAPIGVATHPTRISASPTR